MKKFLALILAAVLLLGVLPAAFAEEELAEIIVDDEELLDEALPTDGEGNLVDDPCNSSRDVRIQNLAFGDLYLNAILAVEDVTLYAVDNGYTMQTDNGYVAFSNGKAVIGSTPYVWKYNGKGFYTIGKYAGGNVVEKVVNVILNLVKTKGNLLISNSVIYLDFDSKTASLALSSSPVTAALRREAVGGEHAYTYEDAGEDGHTVTCIYCGKTAESLQPHYYGEGGHEPYCLLCGHTNPSLEYAVSADVKVEEAKSLLGKTYRYTIVPYVGKAELVSVEYNLYGVLWVKSDSLVASNAKRSIDFRVTDTLNGERHVTYFTYSNGFVTKQP